MITRHALRLDDDAEKHKAARSGCVFYDGNCAFCSEWVGTWRRTLAAHGFSIAPLQTKGVQQELRLSEGELLRDLRLLTSSGEIISGADVYLYVARRIWWAWMFYALFSLPGFNFLLHRGYRLVANNRYCIAGKCQVRRPSRVVQLAPLVLLSAAGYFLTSEVGAWIQMWALVFALFAGFKWMTWWPARRRFSEKWRALAYLCCWPGMDSQPFLQRGVRITAPMREWLKAFGSLALGIVMLWGVIPIMPPHLPLLIGWAGMTALLCVLHFGSLKLLALFWQRIGLDVTPVMRTPMLARSVSDFWGARWNTAFRDLAHREVFAPLQKRAGISTATLAVFLASGLVHDLVISVPARGGYGLPTLYFVIQAFAIGVERSALGRRIGLQRGVLGRAFAFATVLGPATLLFHRQFAEAVMLPFLHAMGAL